MSWFRSQIAALTSRETARPHNNHTLQSPVTHVANSEDVSDSKFFELFWHDASAILNKPFPSQDKPVARASSIDDCEILIHFTDKMVKLLTNNNSDFGCDAQLLDLFFAEAVLDKLLEFSEQRPEYKSRLIRHQLCIYDVLISQSQQQLLAERRFVRPLLKLLHDCKKDQMKDESMEEKLLIVLHQLCMAITQNSSLFEVLIESGDYDADSKFFDLSMLLPYVHRIGPAGQQARDDLLLLLSLSCTHDIIGKYITEKTDFCQVFVVSLSGLYSSLPRTLTYGSDDWHGITEEDVASNIDLQMFLNLLEFCSALVQVSHPVIQDQLLKFVYSGFLVSVIGPTLHQFDVLALSKNLNSEFGDTLLVLLVQSGMEQAIAVTAYMDLFLRKIAEPRLLQTFLRFLLLGKMEDVTVLEALVQRIKSSNSRLCMVTLALFKTLVDLNCEDVMFQLIFKYLLPCTHIMVSQQRSVTAVDVYCKTAEKLISLIPPSCVINRHGDSTYAPTEDLNPGTQWTNRLTNSSACDSPPPSPVSSPSAFQRSRLWFSFHRKSRPAASEAASATAEAKIPAEAKGPADAKGFDEAKGTPEYRRISSPRNAEVESSTPESSDFQRTSNSQRESSSSHSVNTRQWESSYLDYLRLARVSVEECIAACTNWSSQYRGSEGQTLSSISSPRSSAPTDTFSSSDAPYPDLSSDIGSKELQTLDAAESVICDENAELVSPATPVLKRSEDLLSFLVQLNRVQIPEGFEESEDILSEFDQLLMEAKEYGYPTTDTSERIVLGLPHSEDVGRRSSSELMQICSAEMQDNSASDVRLSVSEAELQSPGVRNEVTNVELHLPSNETKLTGSANHSVGSARRYMGSPTIGPFLTALLNKLEAMKQNSLYVNLQLTGLIARLACYPQPLLSSLLLSHTLVFQPSIKSLMQVLNTIKCRTEELLYKMKEKEQMLEQAYNFLLYRLNCHERRDSEDKSSTPSRRHSLMALNSPKPTGETKMASVMSRLKLLDNKRVAYYNNKQPKTPDVVRETQEMVEKKNAIYCAVVFKEFLKELAAISQEHALLLTKEVS